MKSYIIDTNALLSFVTDRNLKQQEIVSELFERAASLECKILCHQHVVTEFVYVLEKVYHHAKMSIHQMITDFIAMPGIEIRNEINFKYLLSYWPGIISDFGDAVVAALWQTDKDAVMVTFDRKFIKEIEQIGAVTYVTTV